MCGYQWRVGPVQQSGGQTVMLGRHQHFPFVDRRRLEMGPGIPDEVPEDVLFQISLGVRSAAELVEAGEQRPAILGVAAVHTAVPPPPGSRVRLRWRYLVDQVAQTVDPDFGNGHRGWNVKPFQWCDIHPSSRRPELRTCLETARMRPGAGRTAAEINAGTEQNGVTRSSTSGRVGLFVSGPRSGRVDGRLAVGPASPAPPSPGPSQLGIQPQDPGG